MRLHKPSVLAIFIGLSNGEREQAAHYPQIRRQQIQNVSSIPYSLASFTSPSFSNSPFGTAPISHVHSPSATGFAVSGNSSIPFRPTGTAPAPHHGSNGSCGQPTLNILDASLDYWYTSTVYNAVSTFSIQFNSDDAPTGWTLVPASTPFNLTSALGEATPAAAQTTVITQTAYSNPNATTGKGQIPNVISTPPPPSITLSSYPTTFSSSDSAFVHFGKYEIISRTTPAYGDHPGACVAVTKTYSLETPFAFPYNGPSSNFSGAGVTGDVSSAFLGVVGQSFAVAGSWKAAPTVAIVVQKVFAAEAVLAASIEATQKSLLVPSATLPSFLSPIHPKTTKEELPHGDPKGHTETTASFLLVPTPAPTKTGSDGNDGGNGPRATPTTDSQGGGGPNMVPFVAHLEHSDTTLLVPTPGTTAVITTRVRGIVVAATRAQHGDQHGGGDGGGGGGGDGTVKVGAIHGTPTNAVQVLSEALASAKDSKPAATGGQSGSGGPHDSNGGSAESVPVIVVGQRTFTGDSQTHFHLLGSQTLTPGGTADIGRTSLSLLAGGSSVVVNGHTEAVSIAVITPAPALTIGTHVYHATGGSTYIIQGQTLTAGGVISVGGTFVSLAPGLSTVVINGKTQPLGATGNSSPAITSPPVLTIGGRQFAAINSDTTYVINGKTLTAGDEETVTIRGETYIVSLAPGATVLKIETLGPNGKVTATMFETLYPAGTQATETSTISACSASAASKHSATSPAKSTGPAASLQNGASSLSVWSAAVSFVLSVLALPLWL